MNADEVNRLERLLALLGIGLCNALRDYLISHDEAERILFSPFVLRICTEFCFVKPLIDFIYEGTELDSIRRLVGEVEWNASIERMCANAIAVLASTVESDSQLDHWMQDLIKSPSE